MMQRRPLSRISCPPLKALSALGLVLLLSPSRNLCAADPASAPLSSQKAAASSAPDEDADIEAPPSPHEKYRKSRYTSDESEALADRRDLLLTTGEDKAVDLDFEANTTANGISIGNPLVVATTLVKIQDKKQLIFKPLKNGETTVTVRDTEGNIRLIFLVRVAPSNLTEIANELRDLLRDVEGVEIRVVGSKIVLEGEVLVPADYGRIATVLADKSYADFVINMSTVSPLGMQVLAKKMQDDIDNFAPNVRTRVVNGVIFLEGNVKRAEDATRAVDIALTYLPEVRTQSLAEHDNSAQRPTVPRRLVRSFLVIDPAEPKKQEKLVRVTVHFVELSKDYEKFFGFKWAPGFTSDPQISFGQGANGATTGSGASFSATLSSLFPKLKSAQTAGLRARVENRHGDRQKHATCEADRADVLSLSGFATEWHGDDAVSASRIRGHADADDRRAV